MIFLKKYKDLILYVVFGGLTTVVNFAVYYPCYNLLHFSATVSNLIAWVVAVAVAFLTNKPFVFHSYDWSAGTVIPELGKFVGCRIGSGAIETGLLFLLVDCLKVDGNLFKLIISVLVIVLNYVSSKLLVFRRKTQDEE